MVLSLWNFLHELDRIDLGDGAGNSSCENISKIEIFSKNV